jgi:arsenical pump membrane protein
LCAGRWPWRACPNPERASATPQPALTAEGPSAQSRLGWLALVIGVSGISAAAAAAPNEARAAADQDWPAFVLVAGLLVIGIVARDDGLFDWAGALLARVARSGGSLLVASSVLVAIVTVTLNLDTSVTFLTPVVLAAARHRRDRAPFGYLVVAMSNGASLLLPGSNLTNLIVLADSHRTGAAFVARVWGPWAASSVTVVLVVALLYRKAVFGGRSEERAEPPRARLRWGAFGVVAAVVAMVVLRADLAAPVVAGVGLLVGVVHRGAGRTDAVEIARYLNLPLLGGLFGGAAALGTLARSWSGPAHLLAHAGPWPTAGIGAGASVIVNNLPAASLLAARQLSHPTALLIGLNLGPNLVLWGSLAGVLWFQSARAFGWAPSVRRFTLAGLVLAPATMAAALGALSAAH